MSNTERGSEELQGRGHHHPDDRTPLAYAYDGLSLSAVAYDVDTVHLLDGWSHVDVTLTPEGEREVQRRESE